MHDQAHHHDLSVCYQAPTVIGSLSFVLCTAHMATTVYGSVVRYELGEPFPCWSDHFNAGPFDTRVDWVGAGERLLTGVLNHL